MSKVTGFVGLDYHPTGVQVCVMSEAGKVLVNRKVRDVASAVAEVAAGCGVTDVQAAVEACSGAASLADELILHHGWEVTLAHPGYVNRMKQNPDKHDLGDAKLLADLVRVGYVPGVWLPPKAIRELRTLVRYRQQIAAERRTTKLRIRAVLRENRIAQPEGRAWTVAWLAWLRSTKAIDGQVRYVINCHLKRLKQQEAELKRLEQRLACATRRDPLVARLLELKGVGLITALTLRAEIGRFDRFVHGKQLARFCGLTPCNASSGQRQADAGLIHAGNPQLRAVLIELAHRLIRYDPRWSRLHAEMRRRGKPGSVIAAAVANRWSRWLFHQMKAIDQAV